ncbi:MAG: di-trans,poly-cis-decaprenylcistransferase [Oscillospiraceae bacterium]|nr:di-trans,poly-cis-decaprenylcistransferase [Oscillospiraceae bacterium]
MKLPATLPGHIAVIMDGNGRWARRRGLPRKAGHAAGAETFRTIATFCRDIGVRNLTVYALSTENRRLRPGEEVEEIYDLLRRYISESLEKMERDRVRLKFLGDLEPLPGDIREQMERAEKVSARYDGCLCGICVNYGGRDEIVRAARELMHLSSGAETGDVTEDTFSRHLDTAFLPDPDLCIRTGGEWRLSNFMPWQLAYAELFFTDTLWPDFSKKELVSILENYSDRNRRYGGL